MGRLKKKKKKKTSKEGWPLFRDSVSSLHGIQSRRLLNSVLFFNDGWSLFLKGFSFRFICNTKGDVFKLWFEFKRGIILVEGLFLSLHGIQR